MSTDKSDADVPDQSSDTVSRLRSIEWELSEVIRRLEVIQHQVKELQESRGKEPEAGEGTRGSL